MISNNLARRPVASDTDTAASTGYPRFHRALDAATEPTWPQEVVTKITSLLRLPAGWDSYGAKAPSWDAAMFAIVVLDSVMRPDTPAPSVVPTSGGGLQLEWHVNKMDLEIHVDGPYAGEFWWRDHVSGEEKAGEINSPDLQVLLAPVARVTSK